MKSEKLISAACERLNAFPEKRLFNLDVDDVINILPDWQVSHKYDGAAKVTTFSRKITDDLDTEALFTKLPESPNRHVSIRSGQLILQVFDIKAEDVIALMQTELLISRGVVLPENQEVIEQMTPQQEYILRNIFKTYGEIAQELKVKESTVRTHASKMLNKFKVTSLAELAVFALRNGVIAQDAIPDEHSTDRLSEAERILVQEYSNSTYEEAAEGLGIKITTIRTHWHNIYRKTNLFNRAQVALVAIRDGLIPLRVELN
jgi:DNA-binding NarL/FixJ family response regulator